MELEEAGENSIFRPAGKKSTREWSARFEHGFSQLVDWFWALHDQAKTDAFHDLFGDGHVKFHGLLVIGRSTGVTEAAKRRLRWREERVMIDSHPVHCITYDELLIELKQRFLMYSAGAKSGI